MVIENVVVKSSRWEQGDLEVLFGDEQVHFTETDDLPSLLQEVGVFESKSQARRAGRIGKIQPGFTELKASKKRRLWIWNPD